MLIDKKLIERAKEELGQDNAFIIAENLGIKDQLDTKNLKAICPFHAEDTPSFVYDPKARDFHCFGCGKHFDIIDSFIYKGFTFIEAVQKVFELAGIQHPFGELGVKTRQQYYYPKPEYADNNDKIYSYLEKRRISKETADYLNLRQDMHGNILIQYFDLNDVLTMVKVRKSEPVPHGETKCWNLTDSEKRPFGSTPILYNMNKVNFEKPLLITSGELDCAAAIEAGYLNAVSIPMGDQNTQWIKECWDFLENFNSIIICPDNDESGMKYCKDVIPRLGSWRCKIANVPELFEDSEGKKHRVKDLNECLFYFGKEKVLDIIYNAKDTPVPSVKDLSDVHKRSLLEMDGIRTGISVIDKELIKLFYGTLTVISGTPGSGKSSLLCQIICNALDQGINTWLFSGELPEGINKDWLTYIFAGRRNVITYTTPDNDVLYTVSDGVENKIDNHYRERWFIYQDDQDNDLDSLLNSMTDVVRKYNVKLLVLDNMMTIDLADTDNDLKEQTKTIKKLISFSKKYNVATILVCHPRKLSGSATVGTYDIAGTSNIANLAHRTIGIRRVTEDEKNGADPNSTLKKSFLKYDVVINIIKDRMRGRSGITRGLYYDCQCRRFYTNYEEFDHQYNWDKNVYKTPLDYPHPDEEDEVFGRIKESTS